MTRQRFLLPALLTLTAARCLLLTAHGLSTAEQHLLECSRSGFSWHPSLGPVLPLLVKAGTALFGENAFGVRCFAPLLILGTSWLLWHLVRGLFDATTADWTLVIFHLSPVVNTAAVTMTLTTAGLTASVGVLVALRHAMHVHQRHHLPWWLLGSSLVLAFLTDWRFIMLVVSCVACLMLTRRGRRALLKWPVLPVLAGCMGLAVTCFIAWNSEHGWKAFAPAPGTSPPATLALLLHVALAFSPLLLAALGWSLVEGARHRPMEYNTVFLLAFIWPLVSLDVLSWLALPWPHCGTGTWLAPAAVLLAHHSLIHDRTPPRLRIAARWITMLAAAVQSCVLLQRGLDSLPSLGW